MANCGRHAGSRLGSCALAGVLGLLAGAALLGALAQSAWAAPAATLTYPSGSAPCNTTLQACIDGANAGDTIVIQPATYITSVTLNQAVSLTGVSSATTILQALAGQRVLTATGAAVDASVVISGLTFTGGSEMGLFGAGGGILLTSGAQPRLESIRVVGNQASFVGGGVFGGSLRLINSLVQSNTVGVFGGGVMTFLDASITGSRFDANACTLDGCQGGGLLAGTAAISETTFFSNWARSAGGGVMALTAVSLTGGLLQQNGCTQAGCVGGGLTTSGTLSLNGSRFISNTSLHDGAGAYAIGAAWLEGGLFLGNSCSVFPCDGGGAYFAATLDLTGTQWISNFTSYFGGGAFVGSTARLNGGLFQGNYTDNAYGAGLYVAGALEMNGTQFRLNSARGGGGGAYVAGAATLKGGLFEDNNCFWMSCRAGGLYAGALALDGTPFIRNRSVAGGGGVWAGGAATLQGGLFQDNSCSDFDCVAGGLYAGSTLGLTDTRFISNVATVNGGALVHVAGDGRIVNVLFAANSVRTGDSPALYLSSPGSVTILHTTIASPTAAAGVAINVVNGSVGITNTIIASHSVGISRTAGTVWENYNLFFGNGASSLGANSGPNHPAGSPAFRDPAAADYHLRLGSAALDAGADAGVTLDGDGQPRPMGAGFDLGYDELGTLLLPMIMRR